jgi:hypothetical protein
MSIRPSWARFCDSFALRSQENNNFKLSSDIFWDFFPKIPAYAVSQNPIPVWTSQLSLFPVCLSVERSPSNQILSAAKMSCIFECRAGRPDEFVKKIAKNLAQFFIKLMHNLNRGKKKPKMWAIHVISKHSPKNVNYISPDKWKFAQSGHPGAESYLRCIVSQMQCHHGPSHRFLASACASQTKSLFKISKARLGIVRLYFPCKKMEIWKRLLRSLWSAP